MTALDAFPPMSCPTHGGDRWSCRPCGERMIAEDRHGYPGACRGYRLSRFHAEQQFPCDCGVGVPEMAPEITTTDVRTLGELRDAVACLIEAHGDAFPVHSYNDGMGCDYVTLAVVNHHEVGLIVEVA